MAIPIVSANDIIVGEQDGFALFRVFLSAPSAMPVTLRYFTSSGTAGTSDYTAIGATILTFQPGETEKTISVPIINDALVELHETFFLNLDSPDGAVIDRGYAQATIIDNDSPTGTPVLSISDTVVDETRGLASFVITLDRPSAGFVRLNYATQAGTASAADFTAVSGSLTFNPGETAKTITVPVTNDTLAEGDERFNLVLSSVTGATAPDLIGAATIAASDQPAVGTPIVSVDDVTVSESDTFATFVVRLSAPSANQISLRYFTSNGTADTNDYLNVGANVLVFAPGETSKTVSIEIKNDALVELHETFFLNLDSPSGAVIDRGYAQATIIDNDSPTGTPVLSISDTVVDETRGLASFVITLDRPSAGFVRLNYATQAGTASTADFTAVSGSLTFNPGETAKTITVPVTNDTLAEGDERFNLVLSSVTGATAPDLIGTATIAASDQPAVGTPIVSVDDVTVGESDTFATFVVRLSAPSANQISLRYFTSNGTADTNDYLNVGANVLVFAPGETSKTVSIEIKNDALVESHETFFLNLDSPSGAVIDRGYAQATIIDNDSPTGTPVLSISDTVVDETRGLASFVITLDRPSAGFVRLNYATQAGTASAADFTAVSGSLTFNPGETAKTITVPVTNDTLAEGDERFNLVLSSVTGATAPDLIGTATIAASDQPAVGTPIVSVDDVTVGESDTFATFVVRLSAPSANQISLRYFTSNGTADTNDYLNVGANVLVFAPGETSKTVSIEIKNDALVESHETFFLNLDSPVGAVIDRGYAQATIIDNDSQTGTPVLSISDTVVDETRGLATFVITLDRPSAGFVRLNYATQAGTASTADFTAVSGSLTFNPGETAKTITVPVTNDTLAEGDERFNLVLSSVTGATAPDLIGTATIAASDQSAAGTPIVSAADILVGESDTFATFVVRLSAPSANQISLRYFTSNGTADTNDYLNVGANVLVFAPGETSKTVSIEIKNDTIVEPDQTFFLNMDSAVGATIAANSTQVMATILDDDTTPVLRYGNSNDTYVVTQANTRIIELPNGGTDLVRANVSFTLGANLENLTLTGTNAINGIGNAGNNVITGNSSNNVLSGLGGVDTVSYATATAGVTVSLALTTPQNTGGAGTDTLTGFENLTGSNFADNLTGSSAANAINGGAGADVMSGGAGNDTYYVDNAADKVNETAGQGTDTVMASTSYVLQAGTEIEFLRANAGATGLSLTGNGFNNTLIGGTGNDVLNGGAGADVMAGGAGNDIYYVDNVGDVANEAAGAGTDTVRTTLLSETLGQNLENLSFIGSGNFIGTGNTLNNVITGGAGNDTLNGGTGNDTLNGGAGADVMAGGAGNDIYYVDNVGDAANEAAGAGTDTVRTTLLSETLGQNLENLTFIGSGNFTGTGNTLNNVITSGAGNDVLNGGAGADVMAGGAGNDIYYVDNVGDAANEAAGAGTDTVRTTLLSETLGQNLENLTFIGSGNFIGTGNTLNNVITGGAGNDTLNGGTGNDTLNGGAGNDGLAGGTGQDSFLFNQALNALTNVDNILDFSVVDDTVLLSHLVFTALGPVGTLAAGEFFTGATAGDAGDRIIYNSSTGALSYDADGTGSATQVQFAHLTSGLALTNSDFRVV